MMANEIISLISPFASLLLVYRNATQHQKTNDWVKKWAEVLKRYFFQRGDVAGQEAHEKMTSITSHQRNANQTQNETTSHLSDWLSSKRIQIIHVGVREYLCSVDRNVN